MELLRSMWCPANLLLSLLLANFLTKYILLIKVQKGWIQTNEFICIFKVIVQTSFSITVYCLNITIVVLKQYLLIAYNART